MSDLTDFLLARIAEDEAAWSSTRHGYADLSKRMLAECEAKRRIVEALEDERQRKDIYNRDYDSGRYDFNRNDLLARRASNARWAGLEIAARALATVHADHPDHREEWTP